MTVLMTIIGMFVFILSCFTQPFKVAVRRLWLFALTGVLIDMLLISLGVLSGFLAVYY